jgi:hypothetical protein
MPQRSILYLEFQDALAAGGCPLCRLGRQGSDSYLKALIHEGVTDPALREELRAAHGLCYRHAWRLGRWRGSVPGTAIIYEDVINSLLRVLAEPAAATGWPRGSRKTLADRLSASAQCPACRLEHEAEARAAKTLLAHLAEPDMAASYAKAGGLCLPHFQAVLKRAREQEANTVTAWQSAVWQQLKDELTELIRKHDHRYHTEPMGDEGDSWQRAIAAIVGPNEPEAHNGS